MIDFIYCGSGPDFENGFGSGSDSGSRSRTESRTYLAQLNKFFIQNLAFQCQKVGLLFFFTFSTFVFHFMLDPAGSAKSKKKLRSCGSGSTTLCEKDSTYLKCLCPVGELSRREGVEQSKRDTG
jgi:hypothetical protein